MLFSKPIARAWRHGRHGPSISLFGFCLIQAASPLSVAHPRSQAKDALTPPCPAPSIALPLCAMPKPSFLKRLSKSSPTVDNYTGPRAPPSALKTLESSSRKLKAKKGKHRASPASWQSSSSDDEYTYQPSPPSPPSSPTPTRYRSSSPPPPPPPDYLKPRATTRAGKARHSVSFVCVFISF